MTNINDFYNSILNIRDMDYSQLIENITIEEKNKLLEKVSDLTGFCKYLASQINIRLKQNNIKTYLIDLNNIEVDHVFLIAEYKFKNEIKRILIDPTYIQFVKTENKQLIGLDKWPSDILYLNTLKELIEKGTTFIDNDKFNNYLNSFGYNERIDIDDFLLDCQIKDKKI